VTPQNPTELTAAVRRAPDRERRAAWARPVRNGCSTSLYDASAARPISVSRKTRSGQPEIGTSTSGRVKQMTGQCQR